MSDTKLFEDLKNILQEQTDPAVAKFFANNALLAYESDRKEPMLETRAQMAYTSTVQTVEKFVYDILLMEILAKDVRTAEAVIHLPKQDIIVRAGMENSLSEDTYLHNNTSEMIQTPMGNFDDFTYRMMCSVPFGKNPLKIFFKHIYESLRFITIKLELSQLDWQKVSVNRELLEEYHIQESVEIHPMLSLLFGVESFLDSEVG